MAEKRNGQNPKELLRRLDPRDSKKLKELLQGADLNEILKKVDPAKAEQKLKEMNLSDQFHAAELSKALEQCKKNPEILEQLKKKL